MMRREFARLNWQELGYWAQLVAEAWSRTHRNPTGEECGHMAATARELAAARAVLQ